MNAIKHARATRISLDVGEREQAEPSLGIRIVDDGRGLADLSRIGIGIPGMRERVEALAGRFEIESVSSGTTLSITVPIDPEADGLIGAKATT